MRIAITGGIGAGKSFVCRSLNNRGIDVYDCDAAAKRLMRTSPELRDALRRLVGDAVYKDGVLQKQVLAAFLLASDANNSAVADIVHPAVAADYLSSSTEWLESAILFDSGFYKRVPFDFVVCVTAPVELRIKRIMTRDGITRGQAREWIGRQLPQHEVVSRSDFEIVNDGFHDIDLQINTIINKINKRL